MVRRLKEDVRTIAGGFPERKVVQVDLDGLPQDAPELVLSRLLNEYREVRLQRVEGDSKRKQAEAALLCRSEHPTRYDPQFLQPAARDADPGALPFTEPPRVEASTAAPEHAAAVKSQAVRSPTPRVTA